MTIKQAWEKARELLGGNADIWREDGGNTYCVARDYRTQQADGKGSSWEEAFEKAMAVT
jgi:hypothetical protein